jgi:DNA-directed RNA polymerase subunit K/omega
MSHKAQSYFGGGDSDEEVEEDEEVASESDAGEKNNGTDDEDEDEKGQGQEDEDKMPDGDGDGDEDIAGSVDDEDGDGEEEGEGDIEGDVEGDVEGDRGSDEEEEEDGEGDENGDGGEDVDGGERVGEGGRTADINAILSETVDDDDADDGEDNDENYLQKFNSDLNKSYILDNHPECVIQNYHEILALCNVVRDKSNDVVDALHRTCPYLTKYEKTRILGQRAKQINSGAPAFIKVPETIIDGYLIAELELEQKKIPFIIRRPLPNGGSEFWKIKDLENIIF